MGFFSDLKEDLSQAVNELMPEDEPTQEERFGNLNEMLDRLDSIVVPEIMDPEPMSQEVAMQEPNVQESEMWKPQPTEEPEVTEAFRETTEGIYREIQAENAPDIPEMISDAVMEGSGELAAAIEPEQAQDIDPELAEYGNDFNFGEMQEKVLETNDKDGEETEIETENQNETKGESKVEEMINARMAVDETSSITAGMTINGDVLSEGSVDLIGCVNGNIDILGKLNVTGYINGNSKAAEIFADNAKINGEVVSEGAVKIGSSSVVIGNICATSAVIAGAVKGDIDVKGPVILDTSAIVMGNIKSKSVQINNGAVIEGMCSQCYAEVNPISFFDDYKPEVRNSRSNMQEM